MDRIRARDKDYDPDHDSGDGAGYYCLCVFLARTAFFVVGDEATITRLTARKPGGRLICERRIRDACTPRSVDRRWIGGAGGHGGRERGSIQPAVWS